MKVAILGGGFCGLTAALRLLQQGHQVVVIEKDTEVGGLAVGFSQLKWDWSLEKAYHHWFTNDDFALKLAKELGHKVIITRPRTDVFINQRILPFDSAKALLTFPYLKFFSKVQTAATLIFLKYLASESTFSNQCALDYLRKTMGDEVVTLIWEPLMTGKFGDYASQILMTWFWARIKKRTSFLAYPEGGFLSFAKEIENKIRNLGGEVQLKTAVKSINSTKEGIVIETSSEKMVFDRVVSTLPSPVFCKIASFLPQNYINNITSIPHLSALNLILILDEQFMPSYWLNITDKQFPFLVLAEHTNFIDKKHYANQHILYIGNYLPPTHPSFKFTPQKLLVEYSPYLEKINPNFKSHLLDIKMFSAPFAQPVVTQGYREKIPLFHSPLKNIYIANMDMVYPWDRGTNYAIKMGEDIAEMVDEEGEV